MIRNRCLFTSRFCIADFSSDRLAANVRLRHDTAVANPGTCAAETDPGAGLLEPSSPIAEPQEVKHSEVRKTKAAGRKQDKHKASTTSVMWEMPDNIAGKDLFWGQGGEQRPAPAAIHVPRGRPQRHQSQVRCTRCHWQEMAGQTGSGVPARGGGIAPSLGSRLLRERRLCAPRNPGSRPEDEAQIGKSEGRHEVNDARFARKPGGQKKMASGSGSTIHSSEPANLTALRVMMAWSNNWDLKDDNNAVYEDQKNKRQIFLVSDVGASFGANDFEAGRRPIQGQPGQLQASKFIVRNDRPRRLISQRLRLRTLTLAESFGVGDHVCRNADSWIGSEKHSRTRTRGGSELCSAS